MRGRPPSLVLAPAPFPPFNSQSTTSPSSQSSESVVSDGLRMFGKIEGRGGGSDSDESGIPVSTALTVVEPDPPPYKSDPESESEGPGLQQLLANVGFLQTNHFSFQL